jgi:hypothetical protein
MFSAKNLNCASPQNLLEYNKPEFQNWSKDAEKSSNPCKLESTIQTGLQLFFDNHVCLDGPSTMGFLGMKLKRGGACYFFRRD